MFGYVKPDKPGMYIKDFTLYQAFYCGLCKTTGKCCGQLPRLLVNYDITFINILLHNILGIKVNISSENCILNPWKKRSMTEADSLTEDMASLNLMLLGMKIEDGRRDGNTLKASIARALYSRQIKKAEKALPEVARLVKKASDEQAAIEKDYVESVDRAAHPFADMMREIVRCFAGARYTGEAGELAYNLGRFVYLLDALDDYDKDVREKNYNPFYAEFKAKNVIELKSNNGKELDYLFRSIMAHARQAYDNMNVRVSEGVLTNIIWYGLNARYLGVFKGEKACTMHSKYLKY